MYNYLAAELHGALFGIEYLNIILDLLQTKC